MEVKHHGAASGVTGSCHELFILPNFSVLVDIGLFQGAETSGPAAVQGKAGGNSALPDSTNDSNQAIDFKLDSVQALVITHCHIDHVGRLPWLLIAGFRQPIYCTKATAMLLPLVIEDALKIGMTRNSQLIEAVLTLLNSLLHPVHYDTWLEIGPENARCQLRFRQAGHILGSAYVEFQKKGSLTCFSGTSHSLRPKLGSLMSTSGTSALALSFEHEVVDLNTTFTGSPLRLCTTNSATVPEVDVNDPILERVPEKRVNDPNLFRVVFSGDLGCKNTPLLPDPEPLERADMLILESTYGNKNHENRIERQARLRKVIEHCVSDRGAVLIPAFSIGRTQELLYELEDIIFQCKQDAGSIWQDITVIVDSPMAAEFTFHYRRMRDLWDAEAHARVAEDRHPLNFERMHIVDNHDDHVRLVNYLKSTGEPCIVIAASGMCTGGRMLNYLRALLPDPRTDVLFVGYQAEGTPGRDIQRFGPRGGYVDLDGERIWIKAEVHTLGGYSAHADQQELIDFIANADHVGHVRLVHGDATVQRSFANTLRQRFPAIKVDCACDL